ncbi:MAG TPA: hypothetical protein PK911_02835 [Candidatus Saccharibacteria bacterium]|nr:hypothetical protein [Candidatus Saccharibacteria bacterium]
MRTFNSTTVIVCQEFYKVGFDVGVIKELMAVFAIREAFYGFGYIYLPRH